MSKNKRTLWTKAQVQEFRDWHQQRLIACNYSGPVFRELEQAREDWLATVKTENESST